MLLLLVVRKGSHRDYFRSWCSLLFIFNKNKFNWKPIKSCRLNRFMFGLCQAGGIKFRILNPLFNSTCHGVSPEMKLSFRKSFYPFFILSIHLYLYNFNLIWMIMVLRSAITERQIVDKKTREKIIANGCENSFIILLKNFLTLVITGQ